MENQHLLSKNERSIIESKYRAESLFRALRDVVCEWERNTNDFSLSVEDLFYHTLYTIDILRCAEDKNERIDTCNSLWNEMYCHIKNNTINADEKDMRNASSIVISSVDYSLMIIDMNMFLDEMLVLKKSNETNNEGSIKLMEQLFKSWFVPIKRESLEEWLRNYWQSKVYISNDIHEMIDDIRNKDISVPENNMITIAKEISPLFYNDLNQAISYVEEINGLPSSQIHEITNKYLKNNIISCVKSKTKLAKILISHDLLHETISNWNIYVNYPPPKK